MVSLHHIAAALNSTAVTNSRCSYGLSARMHMNLQLNLNQWLYCTTERKLLILQRLEKIQ